MAKLEKENKKKIKRPRLARKTLEEERTPFENRPDVKKLVLYTIIVPRGQGENIVKILKSNKSSLQFLLIGEGTATNSIRDILNIEDTKKDIVYSLVREDAVEDIKREIDVFFIASKRNKGIAYTIPLTSIIGVKMYKFITQTVRG